MKIDLSTCTWDEAFSTLNHLSTDGEWDALMDADGTDSWRAPFIKARKAAQARQDEAIRLFVEAALNS